MIGDARTRILDAAEELFAGGGYDATPTSVIAKLASVPTARSRNGSADSTAS